MRVVFHKVSDLRHTLEIVRDGQAAERITCETRSYLMHDLLHYAVEGEAGIDDGFWGRLSAGQTLTELSDRGAGMMEDVEGSMLAIERIVGALTGAAKGQAADQVFAGLRRYAGELGWAIPVWLTVDFVRAVQQRMRKLVGHWKATPYGGAMELRWPPLKAET